MKSFTECLEIDLKEHMQLKPTFFKDKVTGKPIQTAKEKWLDYVEWAVILKLLYTEAGAESVSFVSVIHPGKIGTLQIHMKIDGKEYFTDYPIINGNQVITSPNQMDIHRAELRGFVKCVAVNTGLGLNLWMKEEAAAPEDVKDKEKEIVDITFLLAAKDPDKLVTDALLIADRLTPVQKEQINNRIKELRG